MWAIRRLIFIVCVGLARRGRPASISTASQKRPGDINRSPPSRSMARMNAVSSSTPATSNVQSTPKRRKPWEVSNKTVFLFLFTLMRGNNDRVK